MDPKPPIFNCHTHIFNQETVPPYLAKTFIPWPLYLLTSTRFILPLFRWWFTHRHSPYDWPNKKWYRWLKKGLSNYRAFLNHYSVIRIGRQVINTLFILHAIIFLFEKQLIAIFSAVERIKECTIWLTDLMIRFCLLFPDAPLYWRIVVLVYVVLFLKEGRNLLFRLSKNFLKLTSALPDKKTLEFVKRYINIGRFTIYINPTDIFEKLYQQYPPKSRFVILPMDLEYMQAGRFNPKKGYRFQMERLALIKKRYHGVAFPFVFIDPRRIAADPSFLTYTLDYTTGSVELNDCFVKTYMEEHRFFGFKIYPALGYYPFDERLLVLWKYAQDRNLPIMTHAIRGTIYYRGPKKKVWGQHPVFVQGQYQRSSQTEPLLLPERQNIQFINNFTHPLNFLCLVDEGMLRKVVAQCSDEIKALFGYDTPHTPLKRNLNHLKICMGHYGGEDEWKKYLELDRDVYTPALIRNPETGILFFKNSEGEYTDRKIEDLWKKGDWYSIISSMMLQYNVYADISYILHDPDIIPQLKSSLQYPGLRNKILFGTDFYVVRNHKSEKEMLGELQANLSEADFDQITRYNPVSWMTSVNYKPRSTTMMQGS